jgi:hypothetical protein
MKNTFSRCAVSFLLLLTTAAQSSGAGRNLVIGVGPVTGSNDWAGYSALNLIPGTAILPVASTTTVFYLSFTGGTEADISHMVLYQTIARGNTRIASVTPLALNHVANPSIDLANKTVCRAQPVSVAHPCVVRLDPVTLSLSPLSDYWLVIFFTNESNNATLSAAAPQFQGGSLSGFFDQRDDTQLTVGQSLPNNNTGKPYFLVAVQTN